MKKFEVLENITIETMAAEGKCLGHIDGQVIFMKGGAPGDVVSVELTKIKKNFLEGRVVAVHQPSPNRVDSFCQHFGTCGGCSWQHIRYETQLHYKQQQVVDNLERIGELELPTIQPIIPSANTTYYRNKLDFTFTANRWLLPEEMTKGKTFGEPGLGYHMPRFYDKVFDAKECFLQPDPSNAIRLRVRDVAINEQIPFFDLRKQVGFLRTLTIRTTTTGDVMIILQVTYDKMEWIEKILKTIDDNFTATSLNYIINGKRNDTFHDLDVHCWKGTPYITEEMPHPSGEKNLRFRIGPKSFYQTNPIQAHELYKKALAFADFNGEEVVYDLFTGTGTIANYISSRVKKVIGLEYVANAVEDARVNASLNGITNADFFAGDVKDLLNDTFLEEHGCPDVIITDPPRAGMHEDVTRMLLNANPKRIIYVSCNPATQARDLKILADHYTVTAIQPVDMFPHTMHVENVVRLDREVDQ